MRSTASLFGLLAAAICACTLPAEELERADAERIVSLKDLQRLVNASGRAIESFRIEGVVCARPALPGTVVLQDASAAVLLELPGFKQPVSAGDTLVVAGTHCTLTRGPFGVQVGTAPLVDIDGLHDPLRTSGQVYLEAGRVPLRVEWFNGWYEGCLEVEWEGPGVSRTSIPDSALWRRNPVGTFEPGLSFSSYAGHGLSALPDFRTLTPSDSGSTANLDISRRSQPQDCAMVFTGFLQVTNPGIYTLDVLSDDGCRVYLGDPEKACAVSVVTNRARSIVVRSLAESLSDGSDPRWSQIEGMVGGVLERSDLLELEVSLGRRPLTVVILSPSSLSSDTLAGSVVRATGIHQRTWGPHEDWPARLVVPSSENLVILDPSGPAGTDGRLTFIDEIRSLASEQARKRIRARISGIVTMADRWSFVLQDGTGGIYLRHVAEDWVNQPRPGEVWEIEGVTDAGDFSPIVIPETARCLGQGALPRGIRPTWSEFMDGSLDAEQVEIEAAVTAASGSSLTLLTRGGAVTLMGGGSYPLPSGSATVQPESLVGSVVRVRGVFAADWDPNTRLVRPGVFWLGNAMLSVIEPAPADGFAGEIQRVSDLLLFKSQTAPRGRVKVAGVTLHSRPREYILFDGSGGIRVYSKEAQVIQEGDWVEAVGFPQLVGPTPVLLEAEARMLGSAAWPKPAELSVSNLVDQAHDAMLVCLEALLLTDTLQKGERVLELQAGPHRFLARLRSDTAASPSIRPGSRLRLTGVYSSVSARQAVSASDAFELLLSRSQDLVVLEAGPWWTTRRILSLVLILAVGLAVALGWAALLRRTVGQRTTQLKREIEARQLVEQRRVLEEERSRVAQDLHDDLGAGLAELAMLGALANNPSIHRDKQTGYLQRLAELARLLVTGLDEIVWAINPRHDSHASVTSYLCDYAQEFLHSTEVRCRIDASRDVPGHAFNAHQRHQLFLAFKEALTNVVKHAQATEVWVRIGSDDGVFWVAVEDNGRGLQTNEARQDGDGLANMRKRMKLIGGECDLQNRSGGGTQVRFRITLRSVSRSSPLMT